MPLKRHLNPSAMSALPRALRGCYRRSSTASPAPPAAAPAPEKQEPEQAEEEEESALTRRFTELAESARLSSPSSTAAVTPPSASTPTSTPPSTATEALTDGVKTALAARLASASFASTHAQAISLSSLPSSAPKLTRDLAASPPWTGTESLPDAVHRMLSDARPPLPVDLRPRPKPSLDPATRISTARDSAMEYKLHERDERRELLAERFSPYGRTGIAGVSAVAAMAEQRIREARERGEFDGVLSGGRREEARPVAYVDTTEFLLNRIVARQGMAPAWVEKQKELVAEVAAWRKGVREEWKRRVAVELARRCGVEEACRRAEGYADAERRLVERRKAGEKVERDEGGVYRDPEWERRNEKYHTLAIEQLNELLRSYNMMAPEVARRPILVLRRELDRCYADVAPQVAAEIRERARRPEPVRQKLGDGGGGGGSGSGAGSGAVEVRESKERLYGFRDMVKDLLGWGGKTG